MIPGDSLGSYKLVREIGSGVTSRVYLAERAGGHLTGQVAVKIFDPAAGAGAGSEKRFRAESGILAGLDHPRIARFLESGLTAQGRPYHVMEYVEGEPITRYCDGRELSLTQRMDLFVAACRAVEYAHGRLIVHRDLKPANILVTREGAVKLLDFGIAQMLDRQAGAPGPAATTMMAMTPEYASPEQVRGQAVTTATDVYSLGVLLYELLSGRRPYDTAELSPAELETVVCERDPKPPSTAATDGESARTLAGDLDNIVLKALHKDPARRYVSARELAEDLSRYRLGLPVHARPATAGYRAAKFVRRHPLGTFFAAAMSLATALFLAGMVVLQARTLAARDRARAEAKTAREVTEFLLGVFEPGREDATARELLDRGAAQAEAMPGDPEVRARTLGVMGRAYASLGHYDVAEPLLRRSVEIFRETRGPEARETGTALDELGTVQLLTGRAADAEATHREAVAILDAFEKGPDGARLVARAHLGHDLAEQGRFDEAEPLLTQANEEARARLGADNPAALDVLGELAWMRIEQGKYDEAVPFAEGLLEARRRQFGPAHPEVAEALDNLALTLRRKGDLEVAEPLFRQSIEIRRKVLGADHPSLARTLDNLGIVLGMQGRWDDSEVKFKESLAILERRLGPENPEVATAMNNLAVLYGRKGDYEREVAIHDQVIALRTKVLGPEHPLLAASLSNRAAAYINLGRFAEAEASARRALEIETEAFGRRNPNTASSIGDLAAAIFRQGRLKEAEALHREALSIRRETLGEESADAATSLRSLGLVLREEARYDEAEESLRASLAIRRKVHGERHFRVAQVLDDLGTLMVRKGDLEAAEPLFAEALSIGEESQGADHPRVRATVEHLADLYERAGRPDDADAMRKRLEEGT